MRPEGNHNASKTEPGIEPVLQSPSLLWPADARDDPGTQRFQLSADSARDLDLDNLLQVFSSDQEHRREIRKVLSTLCQDPAVIGYRQEVIADLLENPSVVDRLSELLPAVDALGRSAHRVVEDMTTLHEVTWRMGELQSIIDVIQGLGSIFENYPQLNSAGLGGLRDAAAGLQANPTFQNLVRELPALLSQLRTSASVTIGVNLDQYLRPVEATLLAVNEQRFSDQSLLKRLFGSQPEPMQGIAPLHVVPKKEVSGPYALPVDPELGRAVEPMMVPLFDDLAKVLEKTTQPIAKALKRYVEINSRMFVNLRQDLIYYLGALRFLRRLKTYHLPVCQPELAPMEDRLCQVKGAYNANLALRLGAENPGQGLEQVIVRNDICMGPAGRALILTGPNRGGKTTYLQAAGLVQVLAQAGLFVPGEQARLSPVDQIFTHFPLEEKLEADTGRFGDEARRLSEIFQQVTPNSLVLLNEALSGTSAGESLYLAQDVVRILRRVGARLVYSTHLHELAERAEALNSATPGDSKVVSLVASPIEESQLSEASLEKGGQVKRSYRVEARPPMGRSYARQIAARYGIEYDQLERMLIERGVLE